MGPRRSHFRVHGLWFRDMISPIATYALVNYGVVAGLV